MNPKGRRCRCFYIIASESCHGHEFPEGLVRTRVFGALPGITSRSAGDLSVASFRHSRRPPLSGFNAPSQKTLCRVNRVKK